MKKSWGLLPKILSGHKTIESRWYQRRVAPWDRVHTGDTVYFKDAGEPVTVRARVKDVLQFVDLTPQRVHDLLLRYGAADGLAAADLPTYEVLFRDKRYCILVFLEYAEPVSPFAVDKRGYGAMAAWLVLPPPGAA